MYTHVFRHKICVCIHVVLYKTCIWGMSIHACSETGFMYTHVFGHGLSNVRACLDIRDMCDYVFTHGVNMCIHVHTWFVCVLGMFRCSLCAHVCLGMEVYMCEAWPVHMCTCMGCMCVRHIQT